MPKSKARTNRRKGGDYRSKTAILRDDAIAAKKETTEMLRDLKEHSWKLEGRLLEASAALISALGTRIQVGPPPYLVDANGEKVEDADRETLDGEINRLKGLVNIKASEYKYCMSLLRPLQPQPIVKEEEQEGTEEVPEETDDTTPDEE